MTSSFNSFLGSLQFDNRLVRELPADHILENYPRQVVGAAYSRVDPTKVTNPKLVSAAREVADLIDLPESLIESSEFTQIFSGNQLLKGMEPYACCYGGHQFGHWAGQLGDGRAINLGEVKNNRGEHWTLQLKGAGPTPYSRTADGLAVLRSSIREFLCSEAMFHLGIPTTRALSVITTGESVHRDMFYDGNPELEPGAVVCRVARSFIRFGNVEIFSARGDITLLKKIADFTIASDFPHLLPHSGPAMDKENDREDTKKIGKDIYAQWFNEICITTAQLIAHWMRVGFVHGVMNTDNMSILGLTLDYGPYGWLEEYDPNWTPNTTDAQMKRYAYAKQPHVGLWNLAQLAKALHPLIEDVTLLESGLKNYRREYEKCSVSTIANKLGLRQFDPDEDAVLLDNLQELMASSEIDMTIFYRLLATLDFPVSSESGEESQSNSPLIDKLMFAYYASPTTKQAVAMENWLRDYGARLQQDFLACGETQSQRRLRMNSANPKYILRNYLAQQAIEKASQGDNSEVNNLLDVLRKPYDEQPQYEAYFAKRPEWARYKAGCSMLSCSS